MRLWTHNLLFKARMIQRRYRCLLFTVIFTPSRVLGLLLTILVATIVMCSELFSSKNKIAVDFVKYDKLPPLFRYGPTQKTSGSQQGQKKIVSCPIFQFKASFENLGKNTTPVACKRTPPISGSCSTAKEIFHSSDPVNCSFQEKHEFCLLQRTKLRKWIVSCDASVAAVCTSTLSLGIPSRETGTLLWEDYQNVNLLGEKLTEIVGRNGALHHPQHYGFAFINCQIRNTTDYPYSDQYYHPLDDIYAEQLLILPPVIKNLNHKQHHPTSFHDLSLNIILVDSVSHQHFFRSLPKTVSVLEEIASKSSASVLNFELYQAIKSRTFETLQVIFSGAVNVTEPSFGIHDMPTRPLDLKPIFQTLRDRGHKTLWLEDLCYLWEWGISKDLHFLKLESSPEETWKRMWETLEINSVDDVGATLSMCRLLERNGVKDHFHGPEAVCFNGKHQHEYLLEYIRLYQEELSAFKQPFLTMTSTNVGHEATGRRIQTLDQALADYMNFTPSLHHTITVLFSDHGNAYGKYFLESKEAHVELHQPFMFFIIPHSASRLLGSERMNSIKMNTKRLITALDFHYTLKHISDLKSTGSGQAIVQQFSVNERGLFHPVDPLRLCNSVPRINPNVCICQSFSIQLDTSSYASLFGYFAVGIINDEIQRQYRMSLATDSSQLRAFGNCHPLYFKDVTDIKETPGMNGQRLFQMDIHVQMSQIFFVSIRMTMDKQRNPSIVLETVTRTTMYGIYKSCSDPSVELSLCICNVSADIQTLKTAKKYPSSPHSSFQDSKMETLPFLERMKTRLQSNPCIYLLYFRHRDGAVVFSVNVCENIYTLDTSIDTERKHVFYHLKGKALLLPGGVSFLAFVASEKGLPWKMSLQVDFGLISS